MSAKLYALIIWVNDDPITGNVVNLNNIVSPRKALEDYKEGEEVDAKCPGFGTPHGVIGKIGDETKRKELLAVLSNDELFGQVIQSLKEPSTAPALPTISSQKRKKKSTTDATPSKASIKKAKLNLEKAAENQQLLELELTQQELITDSTSSLIKDSLDVMYQGQPTEENETNPTNQPDLNNVHLEQRVEYLESQQSTQWATNEEFRSNITWLHNQLQMLSKPPNSQYQRNENQLNNSQNGNMFSALLESETTVPVPAVLCTSDDTQHNSYTKSETTVPVPAASCTSDDTQHNSYTKEQLMVYVNGADEFGKAAKLLLKKLYKPEELKGRSLTGSLANKKHQKRDGLEDPSKLLIIYELIQKKWPFAKKSMINGKLGELLKPSYNANWS